jgi:hypothetical protein
MFGHQKDRRSLHEMPPAAGNPPNRHHPAQEDSPRAPASPEVREAAAAFRLSCGKTLAEASQSRWLVLVFLRHFGCTFTRQILRSLEQIHHQASARGADLVLVHMLDSGAETRYLTGHGDIARIADPQCKLYRAFGLKKGGLRELLGLRVWWLGLVSIFKGCGVGHLAGDGRQMPGVFLFHQGQIVAAQRAKSAADLPDLERLFNSLPHSLPSASRAAPDVPPASAHLDVR